MPREWTAPASPFDSKKVLWWRERLDQFYAAVDLPPVSTCATSSFEFLHPPVTVDIEPTNACDVRCPWCYTRDFRKRAVGHMNGQRLVELPEFLRAWGVQSVQVTGGGEPLLHPRIDEFFTGLAAARLPWGLITNGINLNWARAETVGYTAAWCGVSVDAGTPQTWGQVKAREASGFFTVLKNIEKLKTAAGRGRCQVAYKFLLHPTNAGDVLAAAGVARELGCDDLHIRAAYGATWTDEQRATAREQLAELATWPEDALRRHVVTHKFALDGTPQAVFPRCVATPLLLTLSADSCAYWCQDHRGEVPFRLCGFTTTLEQLRESWGGLEHARGLRNVNPRQCAKCTFSGYNSILSVPAQEALHVSFL